MDVKRKKFGFTLVEILTVLGIIALLVGLLIPAMSMVRNTAREVKQKAQLTTIGLALTAFKNDYGDYPPSDWTLPPEPGSDYCGAQKLAEALLGWDLLGFHPNSAWRADGYDGLTLNGPLTYDPGKTRDINGDGIPDTLDERRGPYLELATTNAFMLGITPGHDGLFANTQGLHPDTFVICDVFGVPQRRITLANGEVVTPGTPILYYRANTSSKTISSPAAYSERIYNVLDNAAVVVIKDIADDGVLGDHPLGDPLNAYEFFYGDSIVGGVIGYIEDPKVTAIPWPYRPDSYILISAGADGLYGTGDDITNFGN